MLRFCALHPSFLHKFTLIWHHAFAPCTQLIAFFQDLGALCALRRAPKFDEIHLKSEKHPRVFEPRLKRLVLHSYQDVMPHHIQYRKLFLPLVDIKVLEAQVVWFS
jgi:hypothetical protein